MARKSSEAKKNEKKDTGATVDASNWLTCPDCGEVIEEDQACPSCPYDPSKQVLTLDDKGAGGLEVQRYRMTLRKCLKRIAPQVNNLLIANESSILEEMDEGKPIKVKIPIMVTISWDGENMTLNQDLTVKRVPLKWNHGDQTVSVDACIPGLEETDLQWED